MARDGPATFVWLLPFYWPSPVPVVCHVMEFVRGPDNLRCSREMGGSSSAEVNEALKICLALYEIHQLGVAYIDLRRENVLIPRENADSIVILDFASSRAVRDLLPPRPRGYEAWARDPRFADVGKLMEVLLYIDTAKAFNGWLLNALTDREIGSWMADFFKEDLCQFITRDEEWMEHGKDPRDGKNVELSPEPDVGEDATVIGDHAR